MDVSELISMLSEGLSPEQAAAVKAAIERDTVKAKVGTLKTDKDVATLQTAAAKVADLEAQLDGLDPQGNPRGYRAWYNKYKDAVLNNDKLVTQFEQKYGTGSLSKALEGQFNPTNPAATAGSKTYTDDDILRLATEAWNKRNAPVVANTITVAGNILQKHLLAGRKVPVNFDDVSKLANEKYSGNMEQAYDEWDKPERDRLAVEAAAKAKADGEKEIERRVNEELQKRGATQYFPSASDMTPSAFTERSKEEHDKFSRPNMLRDLATTFVTGGTTS